MNYYVYILQSELGNHFYIGVTTNAEERLRSHNKGANASTRHYRPWRIIYFESYTDKKEAYKREFYLKHPKGFLEKKMILENYRLDHGEIA